MHVKKDIERYFADELSPGRAERMRGHLLGCEACRALYDRQARLMRALHGDLGAPGADELRRMRRRLEGELGLRQGSEPTLRVWRWALGAALAAAVALVLVFVVFQRDMRPQVEPSPVVAESPWLQVEGAQMAGLETPAGHRVKIRPGSRYRLMDSGRVLELAHGKVWCQVTPKRGGFEVHTPEARARVLGTSFVVERFAEARTEVRVLQGRVEVAGRKGKAQLVAAGQRCAVAAGEAARAIRKMPDTQQRSEWKWFWDRLGRDFSQAAEDIGDIIFGD